MRYLKLNEILSLHQHILRQSKGTNGIRDVNALESALAQPKATFAGQDLYPTLSEKTAALGYSLINNHSFLDGNKRVGHAAMEIFLMLNGYEIQATVEEQENLILNVRMVKLTATP